MLQQQVSQFNASILGGRMERPETTFLDTVRIGAGFQKKLDDSQMIAGRGGVKRLDSHDIMRYRVHVGALLH